MYKVLAPWIIWLVLGPLQAVNASPQSMREPRPFFDFCSDPTVTNCMAETSCSSVTWQNPEFPNEESLSGICTLTLNPAVGTCAYRLNFDNLDLSSESSALTQATSVYGCNTAQPYLKVSAANYAVPARCQDLTGYEGIVQLPKDSTEPVILLLQTDPSTDFSFRVNISSIPCADIKTFKSSNVCGIKNQLLNEDEDTSTTNFLRSDISSAESTLLENELKDNANDVNTVELQEKKSRDATVEEPDAYPVEIAETIDLVRKSKQLYDQHSAELHMVNPDSADVASTNPDVADPESINPEFRRLPVEEVNKKNKHKKKEKVKTETKPDTIPEISDEAIKIAEELKKKGDILSLALGVGIESGIFEYMAKDLRVVGSPTNPNEWPWMVLIEYISAIEIPLFGDFPDIKIRCNGILMDESHVVTSATCLPGISLLSASLDSVNVLIGAHDAFDENDTNIINATVSKVTFPMTFNVIEVKDDIAVLTLSESVNFTEFVRPICVPVNYNNFPDDSGVMTGWPDVNQISSPDPSSLIDSASQATSSIPNAVDVKVLNQTTCNETISQYNAIIAILLTGVVNDVDSEDYVCVVKKDTESAVCGVGLGTPLVRKDITNAYYLYGVASPFQNCGTSTPNTLTAIHTNDTPRGTFLNLALGG